MKNLAIESVRLLPPKLIASENKKLPFAKIDNDVVVAPISSTADPILISLSFNTEIPDAKPEKMT